MSWPLSLLVAFLTAVLGGVGAGLVAHVFVSWFRVTSREGAAGYFVVVIALLGVVAGFIIGLVCARIVAGGATPGFGKALGLALGVTAGVALLAFGVGWLSADFAPRIDGRDLMLDVEVRLPPSIVLPDRQASDLYRWNVTITAMASGRHQTTGNLRITEASTVEGRTIVPATVFLATSDRLRTLGVGCADYGTQFFDIALASKPTRADMAWSPWLSGPQDMRRAAIAAEKAVEVRYRVRLDDAADDGHQ